MAGFNVTLLPQIVPGLALKSLIKRAPVFQLFSTTTDAGPKAAGQKARGFVYNVGGTAPAAFDRVSNNYANGTAPDADAIDLTFAAPFKITKAITALHLSSGVELEKLLDSMIKYLVVSFQAQIWALLTPANFPTPAVVGAATALTAKALGNLQTINAAAAGWDEYHAGLVSNYYGNVLSDTDLKTHTPPEDEQLVTGRVRTVYGWDLMNVPGLPTNGANVVGFITDRSGIVLVTAANDNAPGIAETLSLYEIVKDPRTGVTVTLRGYANRDTNEFLLTAEILAAYGLGRAVGLTLLTSA